MYIKPKASVRMFVLVEHKGFEYLGVIQRGMQVGALALKPDGGYAQVNGSFVQPLKHAEVERALGKKVAGPHRQNDVCADLSAPVVRFRRRRHIVP